MNRKSEYLPATCHALPADPGGGIDTWIDQGIPGSLYNHDPGIFLFWRTEATPDQNGGSPVRSVPSPAFPWKNGSCPVQGDFDGISVMQDLSLPCPSGLLAAITFAGDIAAPASPTGPAPNISLSVSEPFNLILSPFPQKLIKNLSPFFQTDPHCIRPQKDEAIAG
ncbi:MAG: hypothetical protein AB7E77_01855 [Desulfobulbus sp.]